YELKPENACILEMFSTLFIKCFQTNSSCPSSCRCNPQGAAMCTGSTITDIPLDSDLFEGLTNLTFLNLGRNFIKKLPPTIFHSLTKLQQLILYYNELEFLEAGIFDKLINLVELKLHQNQIASLPPKVFWPLGNLKNLTLSSNQLQAIPEKSFYHMPKLVKLTIYKNPLLSLPDELMGHMDLPPDVFCCLPNLQKLSLKSNNLHYLHPQLFSKLTTLKKLHLNDNDLPGDIFVSLPALMNLTLSGNPWDCNCAIRGIARWMRHNEHVLWDRDDVMCHTPVYQLLRTVGSLHDEEFSFCSATTSLVTLPVTSSTHIPVTSVGAVLFWKSNFPEEPTRGINKVLSYLILYIFPCPLNKEA
uniref:Platelet glycoprotein V-like n=1 Tax=Haplochromis burtoni TaxID=8153 RepID=A0A3Q2X7X3_HAPBU